MFDNIGGKIKALAKVFCWIEIILSVIIAIIMFVSVEDVPYSQEGLYKGLGCVFLIIGPLLSWISSFVLYGFGELIETNCEIARNIRNTTTKTNFQDTVTPSATTQPKEQPHTWRGNCDMCSKQNVVLSAVKIVDDMGTRYRNVCEECAKKI